MVKACVCLKVLAGIGNLKFVVYKGLEIVLNPSRSAAAITYETWNIP